MLNCSGGWKPMGTDIGRRRLAVNRPAPYHTATHGGSRIRALDLGGGPRPRLDEGGSHPAPRRGGGARTPSAPRDRRDHRGTDAPGRGGAPRQAWLRRCAAPAARLHRRRVRRGVSGHHIAPARHRDRAARRPRAKPGASRTPSARGRERALGPRARHGHRGCGGPEPAREWRAHRVSGRHEAAVGPATHTGVPERRLSRGAVRELHRDGGASRTRPRDDPPLAARQSALAQPGDPLRADELRGSRRASGVFRLPGRRWARRGRAHDRRARSDPRRSGARGARPVTLAGRAAVVTGAGRGIGMAVARALAGAGAAIVVVGRTRSEIEALATELRDAGQRAWAVRGDVTDPGDVETLAREAKTRLYRVDILVNNAGVAHSAPLPKVTLEDWNRVLTVNATGTFLCTQAFLPGMLEQRWGRVVNIASMAGLGGGGGAPVARASRTGNAGARRGAGGWNQGMSAPAGGKVWFGAGQTAPGRAGLIERWAGALERVLAVVRAAGGGPEHIGRMTIYVTDRQTYLASLKPLGEVHRRLMGRHYPAMALVEVRAVVDANAAVEIEATAVLP